jgi:hypothetical protein
MTAQGIRGVGFCAECNEVGDWALAVALECARRHQVRLDIFFFPSSPFEPHPPRGRRGERSLLGHFESIELERRMRLYYDERLGDYLEVGFRLCEGDEDPELRRCLLVRKEYDVLVLPYPSYGCGFDATPLVDFAHSMPCPVILVGPDRPDQLWLNSPARPLASTILATGITWREIPVPLPV